jgi:multiple sugar transport system permease protein
MRSSNKDRWQEFIMLSPALLFLLVVIAVPFSLSVWFSFTDQRLVPRPVPTAFVGLTNYSRLLDDPRFWQAIGNTVLFTVLVVPFQLSISLGTALILNTAIPFRSVFRSIAMLPLLLPTTVVVAIWAVLFRIPNGPLNAALHIFTGPDAYVDWIGSTSTAMVSIVVLSAWATFPYQMLIYLAGLQDIPADLYEAARIDGANGWQRFFNITWPGLRNVNIFLLIITTTQALKLFTQVDVLTKGGPNGATTTVVEYLYQRGYVTQQIGYGSSIAVCFFVVIAGIALLQRSLLKNEGA